MKNIIYGIKDKAFGFSEMFQANGKFDALRRMADAVNNPERTLVTEHPDDFSLFELGEFDTDTGIITPKNEFVEELSALVKKKGK